LDLWAKSQRGKEKSHVVFTREAELQQDKKMIVVQIKNAHLY